MTSARPQPGIPRDYQFPRFERQKLSNGMGVIVAPARKLPLVSVAVVLDVSAVDDPPGREGLAELTAQALREGTLQRDGARLTVDFEKLGTSIETGSEWTSTVASMSLHRDRLQPAIGLLSEVLLEPAFREADISRLRAERLAERMQILAEPRGLADESFSRFVYDKGARYHEPAGGDATSIAKISQVDVSRFYQAMYTPDAATVIIAGDISVDEGVALAERSFKGWSGVRSMGVRVPDMSARSGRNIELVAKRDAEQSELRIGHVGVPRSHENYFDIVVMNAILGGLFSSRINLNLREKHGYTYGASSFFDWRRHSGPFVISTAVQSEATAASIRETLYEVDRMRTEEVSDGELTLATSYLAGVFPIRYETTASIVSALANLVSFGLPDDYYDTYRAKIGSVTTRGVLDAARAHVRAEDLQMVVVGNPDVVQESLVELEMPFSVREPEPS